MQQGFGYWVDLNATQLSEDSSEQWVHALPVGNYQHPLHGPLNFTIDRIKRFADSVNNKVRGIDVDIDYDHKLDPSKGKKAAGWVKRAEARSNGLWLLVEWTKEAANDIRKRHYRYLSSEFLDKWSDAKGNSYQDVLTGAGLTNRPFIKDLIPVNLSELVEGATPSQEKEMDVKELAKLLGLPEDATEEQVKAKLNELSKDGGSSKLDLSKATVEVKDGKFVVTHPDAEGEITHDVPEQKQEQKQESQEEKELAKLAESNPAVAKMLSDHKAMQERLESVETSTRLSEITTQLSEVNTDKIALPPVVQDKLRAVMAVLPKKLSDDIADAMKELVKVGMVQLGEETSNKPDGSQGDEDYAAKFLSEADKILEREQKKDKTFTYAQAVSLAEIEHEELYKNYRKQLHEQSVTLDD